MAPPKILVKPPGPKARKVLARDKRVSSPSMARVYPLVVKRASGVNVWDVDGNRFLDMNSAIAVMNLGYSHPRIVQAIQEQAKSGTHMAYLEFYSELPVRFLENLLKLTPGMGKGFLTNSGAESIEAAMKLARYHTKRKQFLAFYGGFHGRTLGALSLTASKTVHRREFGPFFPVVHAPYCDPYKCPFDHSTHKTPADCARSHLDYLEDYVFRREVAPEEIAAVFVEPVQGEGGYVVPPKEFLQGLRRLCYDHGMLYVDDEVQSGCYRTGKFLAIENFQVKPDIVCLAKAIGGGLPLGAMLTSDELMDWPAGAHATTFGGNLLACAAGVETLHLMQELDLEKMVKSKGTWAVNYLRKIQKRSKNVGEVRGLGLMIGAEISSGTLESSAKLRDRIVGRCFEDGVCFLPAGDSAIRVAPPLIIDQEDLEYGLGVLGSKLS